jgi:hypothetical protein
MEHDMKTSPTRPKPAPDRLIELVRGQGTDNRDQPDREADPDAITERHSFAENDGRAGTGQPNGS